MNAAKRKTQERFCKGCPALKATYINKYGVEGPQCPCPNGVDDFERCMWHQIFKDAKMWDGPLMSCGTCLHKDNHETAEPCNICSRNPFSPLGDMWEPDGQ